VFAGPVDGVAGSLFATGRAQAANSIATHSGVAIRIKIAGLSFDEK